MPEITGQLYEATDSGEVYRAKPDLSGWDLLFPVGITTTPGFTGIQSRRTPNQVIANNTNTTINHTSDTLAYDYGTIKGAAAVFTIPAGKGGIWQISAALRLGSASSPGAVYIDIQNSVGAAAGFVDFDGAITDPTQDFGIAFTGQLELPAAATFNLRVYQNTGNNVTLETYRITANLVGVS
jgi:hypothetical protein